MSSNNFDLKQIELMLLTVIDLLKHLNSEKIELALFILKKSY